MANYPAVTNNRTCLVCTGQQAIFYCECTAPPTLLCAGCFANHPTKNPAIPHQIMPIAALGQDSQDYMQRFRALKLGAAKLRENVGLIDQCRQELASSVQSAIDYLVQYRDYMLQQLQQEKDWFSAVAEAAVKETEDCLAQGTTPVLPLAQALWGQPATFNLFSYSVKIPNFELLSQIWITWENKAKTPPQMPGSQQIYGDNILCCVFCNTILEPSKRRYQFQMRCRHIVCTKLCHDRYSELGYSCPLCEARREQS